MTELQMGPVKQQLQTDSELLAELEEWQIMQATATDVVEDGTCTSCGHTPIDPNDCKAPQDWKGIF